MIIYSNLSKMKNKILPTKKVQQYDRIMAFWGLRGLKMEACSTKY